MNKRASSKNTMVNSNFKVPIDERYFEHYLPGSIYEFGSIVVEQNEVLEFSKLYDPYVFDSGLEAYGEAKNGSVVASGWHTVIMGMRLFADFYISHVAGVGPPSVDDIHWLKAVHPGDELSIRVTIKSRKLTGSKSGKGIVRSYVEIMNQNRAIVTTLKVKNVLLCERST
ncbi:MAG: acyl dehydratase [Syntrophaceae bacterium]|nr:acyl dehydratase [Syntrophaceae bacterium]